MTEPTQPGTTTASTTYGWCAWHRGYSITALLVEIIERVSGPAVGLHACAGCRSTHGLLPLGE